VVSALPSLELSPQDLHHLHQRLGKYVFGFARTIPLFYRSSALLINHILYLYGARVVHVAAKLGWMKLSPTLAYLQVRPLRRAT